MKKEVNVYTPEEVGKILDVAPTTVTKWLRNGHMHGFKPGRLWRVTEDQLQEFIKRRTENGS